MYKYLCTRCIGSVVPCQCTSAVLVCVVIGVVAVIIVKATSVGIFSGFKHFLSWFVIFFCTLYCLLQKLAKLEMLCQGLVTGFTL